MFYPVLFYSLILSARTMRSVFDSSNRSAKFWRCDGICRLRDRPYYRVCENVINWSSGLLVTSYGGRGQARVYAITSSLRHYVASRVAISYTRHSIVRRVGRVQCDLTFSCYFRFRFRFRFYCATQVLDSFQFPIFSFDFFGFFPALIWKRMSIGQELNIVSSPAVHDYRCQVIVSVFVLVKAIFQNPFSCIFVFA